MIAYSISKQMRKALKCQFLLLSLGLTSQAQNPIIQTKYTADPAPYVHGDTIYLYTTHDEDDAQGFKMLDWLLYTSTDMVNWTDHGAVCFEPGIYPDSPNNHYHDCFYGPGKDYEMTTVYRFFVK